MYFDGAEIKVGDTVYDVCFGTGNVSFLHEPTQKIGVNFGSRQFTFNQNGIRHEEMKQTLFWRDPIGDFKPMKNDTAWEKFCQLRTAIATVLGMN